MRTVKITALQGTLFSFTPGGPQVFSVVRANPGTVRQRLPSGGWVLAPRAPGEQAYASSSIPLALYPGDSVAIGDGDEFLDHLIATGQAEIVS